MILFRLPRDKRLPQLIDAIGRIEYVAGVVTNEPQRLLIVTLSNQRMVRVTLYRIRQSFDQIGMRQTKLLGITESDEAGIMDQSDD